MILRGKTINFLGDSLTEGVGVADTENNRYDRRLLRMAGLKAANNYGVGGTRLAHQRRSSPNPRFDLCFCGRAYLLDPAADINLVFGGVNDYLHGDAPIGREGDDTPDTFFGAVEYLMAFLSSAYPAQAVFAAPARCFYDVFYTEKSPRPNKLPDAMPLKGYVDIIEKTAKKHGIPVLNLYDVLPYDPLKNPAQMKALTKEGLHFNDAGHGMLADVFYQFLREL